MDFGLTYDTWIVRKHLLFDGMVNDDLSLKLKAASRRSRAPE
jgi:hypothetical protein